MNCSVENRFMLHIRHALAQDVPLLPTMIHEFAESEQTRAVATDESLLRNTGISVWRRVSIWFYYGNRLT